ncbi:formimidoylglutamase [Changchengzhania lutea]|uniref:formimidoylglutamase n=1 Tax=Changchengzhania lutea TaxID=2049305 RepID=UPI00115EB894|nr:formimidoylglutamase [Changchengzhania lutea]
MDKLVLFNDSSRKKLLTKRSGESKFGQNVQLLSNITNIYEQLLNLDVHYVILGLPEDVGVIANHGKPGACNTWIAVLKSLLNIQNNDFIDANKVLILGHLDFSDALTQVSNLNVDKKKDILKARKLVSTIDQDVSNLIYQIVSAGKIPIIVGGGHNNAYGNIKGTALALNSKINVVNFDAHSDFRAEEGRHSGNGFSYAYAEGFLENYFIFGLHESYTSKKIFDTLNKLPSIKYNTYDALEVREELSFKKETIRALEHVSTDAFGIEIDCDAVQNISSSALTPSGFSSKQARHFIYTIGKHENVKYLHICEAIAKKKTASQTGKFISYLITDFIKANGY